MSLYTLYRPRDWDSVIGQDLISTILRNSLRQGRVGHAYIFTGSRGTGKTTSARILAKGVNCENLQDGNPCHECENCKAFDSGSMLDIIEIDAASNTGVDNIRDLIDKARYEPTQGKWKVYIIDEVHMLSGGAFNALLKTLEEPPPHVKFILATTEIEKVPETIRSRSLRFDFRKITEADIVKRLQFVAKSEGIKIEDEALHIIAKAARGGLRDALTLLEQNTINGEVSTEYVRSTLALLEESLITEIIDTIYRGDIARILEIIEILRERHVQVRGLFDQILYVLRDRLFASLDTGDFGTYESIFRVFEEAYGKIKSIPDGMLLVEITLLRAVKRREVGSVKSEVGNQQKPSNKKGGITKNGETEVDKLSESESEQGNKGALASEFLSPSAPFATFQGGKVEENSVGTGFLPPQEGRKNSETPILTPHFREGGMETQNPEPKTPFSYATLLHKLKEIRPALTTDLKAARYELDSMKLVLIFAKEWNFARVNESNTRNIIAEALQSCFTGEWGVECRLESAQGGDISDGIF